MFHTLIHSPKSGPYTVVERKALNAIPITPRGERSDRWQGVQHGELVGLVVNQLKQRGYDIATEKHCIARDGAMLLSGFNFKATPKNIIVPDGTELSLALLHSNDGGHALKLAAGLRVMICDNGVVSGEYVSRRKHTTGLYLTDHIRHALNSYQVMAVKQNEPISRMRAVKVKRYNDHLINMADTGVLPWSMLQHVHNERKDPQHDDFCDDSVWSFYNHVNAVVKDRVKNPETQVETLLNAFRYAEKFMLN